jgi:hypothetical protein
MSALERVLRCCVTVALSCSAGCHTAKSPPPSMHAIDGNGNVVATVPSTINGGAVGFVTVAEHRYRVSP